MPQSKPQSKPTRGPRGLGTVFRTTRRGKPVWVGRRTVGGRRVEVSAATQRECVRKLAAAGPPGPDVTVAQWAGRWLAGLSVRASTLESYRRSLLVHCAPLGPVPLKDLVPSRVNALLVQLGKSGLAPGSVANVHAHGRACLQAAVRDGLLAANPFSLARRPKVEKKDIDPFALSELDAVIGESETLSAGPLVALLAGTGMRLGEASALDVADWDPRAGTVAVTKTYSRRFGVGPPKSANGRRTITVPAPCRPALDAAAGSRTAGPLFATRAGNRPIKSLVQRAFRRLLGRLGLRYRSVHQLRHSVATHLISAGHPIGDVAAYLGDSEAVVVRTYLHPSGSDAGAAMDRLLGGRKVGAATPGRSTATASSL